MLRALTLAAALMAALAAPPAGAQTTSTTPTGRGTAAAPPPVATPPAASRPTPAAPPATTPAVAPRTAPAATTPPPAATTTPAPTPAAGAKRIDINSASESELASLPGIGPVTAKNIVQGRPWDDLKALVTKKAMAQSVLDRNKDRFALANINTSSAADMAATLPGIGQATAPKIVNGRPYATPADLVAKKVLTERQFDKIKDLITY